MTNICRNQVLHTGVHLISADVIILLIGAVNSNEPSPLPNIAVTDFSQIWFYQKLGLFINFSARELE